MVGTIQMQVKCGNYAGEHELQYLSYKGAVKSDEL